MNRSAAFREEDESMPASLWDVEYLAFDVETTGLSPAFCEIVEFGAVRFTADGTEVGQFQQLVNPGCAIPFHASRVHGITDDIVRGQPRLKTVVPDFLEFLSARPSLLLAHNASFDLGFVGAAIRRIGCRKIPGDPVIDTLSFARARLPHLRRHRLPDLRTHFRIATPAAHRALEDSLVLKSVFLKLAQFQPAVTSLDDVFRLSPPRKLGG